MAEGLRQQQFYANIRLVNSRSADYRGGGGVGAPPLKLRLGREGFAVIFNVRFGRFRSVMRCMLMVSIG